MYLGLNLKYIHLSAFKKKRTKRENLLPIFVSLSFIFVVTFLFNLYLDPVLEMKFTVCQLYLQSPFKVICVEQNVVLMSNIFFSFYAHHKKKISRRCSVNSEITNCSFFHLLWFDSFVAFYM